MIIRKNIPLCVWGECLPAVCAGHGVRHRVRHEAHLGPRPDLTFVYTTHCKSGINNKHPEKQVWISRASGLLRIHTYKILLQ